MGNLSLDIRDTSSLPTEDSHCQGFLTRSMELIMVRCQDTNSQSLHKVLLSQNLMIDNL